MPPRKDPKETVVYPSSKRKAPAFKPQRPSKVPRIPTTESESTQPRNSKKSTAEARPTTAPQKSTVPDKEDSEIEEQQTRPVDASSNDDTDEELDENPLAQRPSKPAKPTKPAAPKRKPPREPPPTSISSQQASAEPSPERRPAVPDSLPSIPSQSDTSPAIPQPLLVRLLHEHFADKTTKIDKHAIQVLQKYFDVFVQEAIARAAVRKKEDAEKGDSGGVDEVDVGWLELEDLEKVAAGMMLDF